MRSKCRGESDFTRKRARRVKHVRFRICRRRELVQELVSTRSYQIPACIIFQEEAAAREKEEAERYRLRLVPRASSVKCRSMEVSLPSFLVEATRGSRRFVRGRCWPPTASCFESLLKRQASARTLTGHCRFFTKHHLNYLTLVFFIFVLHWYAYDKQEYYGTYPPLTPQLASGHDNRAHSTALRSQRRHCRREDVARRSYSASVADDHRSQHAPSTLRV